MSLLPNELLQIIALKLSLYDISKLSSTCKLLYSICNNISFRKKIPGLSIENYPRGVFIEKYDPFLNEQEDILHFEEKHAIKDEFINGIGRVYCRKKNILYYKKTSYSSYISEGCEYSSSDSDEERSQYTNLRLFLYGNTSSMWLIYVLIHLLYDYSGQEELQDCKAPYYDHVYEVQLYDATKKAFRENRFNTKLIRNYNKNYYLLKKSKSDECWLCVIKELYPFFCSRYTFVDLYNKPIRCSDRDHTELSSDIDLKKIKINIILE